MALLSKIEEPLMTAEELFQRPDLDPCELVNGRMVPMAPTGYWHGEIELKVGGALLAYARESGRGKAFCGEVGIYIRRHPDTVRAADALFISHSRLAACKSTSYLDVAPELVVEILSPEDRWVDVMEKLQDYFSAGVSRIWVVDWKARRIFVYRGLTDVVQVGEGEVLSDPELLPGFQLAVTDLFEP